jgi:hypothetical protein
MTQELLAAPERAIDPIIVLTGATWLLRFIRFIEVQPMTRAVREYTAELRRTRGAE